MLLRWRYSEARRPVKIVGPLHTGQLFTTFHTAKTFLNHVTSPRRDSTARTPEYEVTAVQAQKI